MLVTAVDIVTSAEPSKLTFPVTSPDKAMFLAFANRFAVIADPAPSKFGILTLESVIIIEFAGASRSITITSTSAVLPSLTPKIN